MYLNNLGNWLGTRYERTGSMDDIDHAFEAGNGFQEDSIPRIIVHSCGIGSGLAPAALSGGG